MDRFTDCLIESEFIPSIPSFNIFGCVDNKSDDEDIYMDSPKSLIIPRPSTKQRRPRRPSDNFRKMGQDMILHLHCLNYYKDSTFPIPKINTGEELNRFFEDNFEVMEKIGEGSFGEVYRALCNLNQREYAVKIRKDVNKSYKTVCNLVKNVNSLKHPHLMYFDFCWEEEGTFYTVMEMCDGNLKNILDSTQEMIPEYRIWSLIVDIYLGMSQIHRNGFIHFDIKPDNIFYKRENEESFLFKIGDYDMLRKNNSICDDGDKNYMPPEALNDIFSEKYDIYSFGLTILEVMTYHQANLPLSLEKIKVKDNESYIRALVPSNYSDILVSLVVAMLKYDHNERITLDYMVEEIPQIYEIIELNEQKRNTNYTSQTILPSSPAPPEAHLSWTNSNIDEDSSSFPSTLDFDIFMDKPKIDYMEDVSINPYQKPPIVGKKLFFSS